MNLKEFRNKNKHEREKFIDFWSNYVLTHSDKDWSKQQNKIINAGLRTSNITKEQFLKLKEKQ